MIQPVGWAKRGVTTRLSDRREQLADPRGKSPNPRRQMKPAHPASSKVKRRILAAVHLKLFFSGTPYQLQEYLVKDLAATA